MGDRAKRAPRCEVCKLHRALCLCGEVKPIDLGTRLVLIMHRREVTKTTATGPLAARLLRHSEVLIHGERERPLELGSRLTGDRRALLLFPTDDARPLTAGLLAEDRRPITLIVPDGNWRQAQRAARRIPGLERAERVTLVPGPPSRYRLRNEPRAGGLATLEAIARALGVIESPAVEQALLAHFDRMVERTLSTRGATGTSPASPTASVARADSALEILHCDADLVAVNKPAGTPVHRGWARDGVTVVQALRDQLGQRVYPVHRLDRPTSGVLLFALSSETARVVQAEFTAHSVEKRYLALCRGHDSALGRVDHPLAKRPGAEPRPAITDLKLLGQFERYGLFEAWPRTGRLHQIRRHLKHESHPIIGDVRYGKGEHNRLFRERFGFHRLALHAAQLTLRHPRTQGPLVLHAPLPPDLTALLDAMGLLACAGMPSAV
jgi:tRNA pseudouridine65 synthase